MTVTTAGVTAIGSSKVTTAKINDGAVTNAKLSLTGVADSLATTTTLTSSYQTLCNVSVTATQVYLVQAFVDLRQGTISTATPGETVININYAGADHETDNVLVVGTCQYAVSFIVTIASGTTLALKAKDTSAATITARGADTAGGLTSTRLTLLRIS